MPAGVVGVGMHLHQVSADLSQPGDSIRPDAATTEAAGHAESSGSMHGAHAGDTALDGMFVLYVLHWIAHSSLRSCQR